MNTQERIVVELSKVRPIIETDTCRYCMFCKRAWTTAHGGDVRNYEVISLQWSEHSDDCLWIKANMQVVAISDAMYELIKANEQERRERERQAL